MVRSRVVSARQVSGMAERTEEVDLDHADLLALFVEIVHHFVQGLADRAHGHHDALGVRGAIIIKKLIVASGELGHLLHILFHHGREGVVGLVHALAELEADVVRAVDVADGGMFGVQGAVPELLQLFPVHHLCQIGVVQDLDLLDLVAGAEAVEEMLHRQMALDGGEVGHRAQVHALLHAGGGQLGPAGLAACHDVHLVAEDRDVAGGDGAGRDMHDGGELQAGDAVHRRDHQHQALGRGEGRGERAGLQRALDAGDGAGLGLHLDQADRGAENILSPVGGPLVHVVGHGARRGDGIDGCDFGKRVTRVCGGFIAVHGFSDH